MAWSSFPDDKPQGRHIKPSSWMDRYLRHYKEDLPCNLSLLHKPHGMNGYPAEWESLIIYLNPVLFIDRALTIQQSKKTFEAHKDLVGDAIQTSYGGQQERWAIAQGGWILDTPVPKYAAEWISDEFLARYLIEGRSADPGSMAGEIRMHFMGGLELYQPRIDFERARSLLSALSSTHRIMADVTDGNVILGVYHGVLEADGGVTPLPHDGLNDAFGLSTATVCTLAGELGYRTQERKLTLAEIANIRTNPLPLE